MKTFNFKNYLKLIFAILLSAFTFVKAQTVVTLGYTGAVQTFTVPSCVGSITVDAKGAQGGGNGGQGGQVKCIYTVTPGDVLYIYVGGQGGALGSNSAGGFNGGGNAGTSTANYPGAGGGGATDVRLNGNSLSNRIIVAGGGGGYHSINYNPGAGGGLTGGNVGTTGNTCIGSYATGGTQTAGGNACTSSGSCCTFTASSVLAGLGVGGNGSGPSGNCNGGDAGAGGGGGYYGGGGGGTYSSGAGGSSFTGPGATGIIHTQGGRTGNGTITFTYNTTGAGVTVNASGNPICSGSTLSLTASSMTSYTWLPVGTFPGSNSASITHVPTSNTSYTVHALNPSGCTSTFVTNIVVQTSVPNLTVVNSATASSGICPNTSATLTASGALTYSWTNGVTNGVSFSPTSTQTYVVTGGNACGTATAATSISIHPFPTVGAVASTPSLCSGLSATVTATGNAASYTWSPVGITNGAGFFPSFTNTYIVVGTSALSCTASAATVITVVTTPTLAPTANPALICIGNSSTLTATGATNYTWLPGNSSAASIVVSPTAAINTYTVIKSNANCVDTKTLNVIVNQLPTVFAIATPTLVCAGKPSTLAVGGAQTYTWTAPGPPSYTFTGASPVVSPQSNTTYTVAAHDGTCVNTTTVAVATDPNPTLSIAATNTNICAGQSVTLTASGGINYTWTANSTNSATGTSYSDTPSGPTLYSLIGDNSFGCTSTISQIVLVNPNPTITIATSKTLVCSGGPSTITASGANTYVWDANAGGATTAGTIVNPINTMVYTVTGTYASTGCNSTKTVEVKVFTPTITVTNPTNTCYGGNITLVASGANPGTYNWNTGSGFTNPFQTIAVTPTVFTIYTVSAISGSNGVNCPSTQTTSIGIFYNPTITAVPERTFFCRGEQLNIVGNGGVSYVWSNSQTGGTITVSPNTNTNYTVTGTDANGCVSTGTLQVKVSGCVGIQELNGANAGLSIYPNPNNGEFRVASETALELSLMNELGQVVRTISLNAANNYKADISELAQGIYFVSGKVNGSTVNQKIIVSSK